MPNPDQKWYTPQKNFVLPQYRLHTDFSKETYAENFAKIASDLRVLQPIYQGDFFVPNPDRKWYAPQKNFELPKYSIPQKAYAENLAKIASELRIL